MVRTPSFDKSGMKKGAWTPEEDRKLIAYVTRYGCWNWRQLPRFAGLARCGKSCRLRWLNYLRPNIKRGNYTQEEEEIIVRLHKNLGNRWSVIAANLPGRTDNDIKNYWHSSLKRRSQENAQFTHENVEATNKPNDSDSNSKQDRDSEQNNGFFEVTPQTTPDTSDTVSAPLSPQLSSSEFSTITADQNHTTAASNENLDIDDFDFLNAYSQHAIEKIWSETFLAELVPADNGNGALQGSDVTGIPDSWALSPQSSSSEYLVAENDHFTFLETTKPAIDNFWIEQCVADMSHVPNELLLTPFVNGHESDAYFCPVYDVELWAQTSSHDGHIALF